MHHVRLCLGQQVNIRVFQVDHVHKDGGWAQESYGLAVRHGRVGLGCKECSVSSYLGTVHRDRDAFLPGN